MNVRILGNNPLRVALIGPGTDRMERVLSGPVAEHLNAVLSAQRSELLPRQRLGALPVTVSMSATGVFQIACDVTVRNASGGFSQGSWVRQFVGETPSDHLTVNGRTQPTDAGPVRRFLASLNLPAQPFAQTSPGVLRAVTIQTMVLQLREDGRSSPLLAVASESSSRPNQLFLVAPEHVVGASTAFDGSSQLQPAIQTERGLVPVRLLRTRDGATRFVRLENEGQVHQLSHSTMENAVGSHDVPEPGVTVYQCREENLVWLTPAAREAALANQNAALPRRFLIAEQSRVPRYVPSDDCLARVKDL